MSKYVCGVCGFVYDESAGDPEHGIASGTKWDDLPAEWVCPLCGATKSDFEEQKQSAAPLVPEAKVANVLDEVRELSVGELSALCSNLSRGCTKQYLEEEAGLFDELARYYESKVQPVDGGAQLAGLMELMEKDLSTGYSTASAVAGSNSDRGALRALVWGEKVTKILHSLVKRYEAKQDALLKDTNLYVCDICGFAFVGDDAPDVCPVCKVPKTKLVKLERS